MSVSSQYEQTIDYLNDLYLEPFVPSQAAGLRRASRLLAELGNPQDSFRSVHIAGTSGKGSTTMMIESILRAAGFRAGRFNSPHLYSYRERIGVDDSDITEGDWTDAFLDVWPIAERMRSNELPDYDLGRPTLIEILFAMMCVHFRRHAVEWGAVEAGLGGRLDATNLLQPDVAVLTNVSLEHTRVLGDTVSAIAEEKAAIIKPGSHSVTAATDESALTVIQHRAREVGSPLLQVGHDLRVTSWNESLHGQDVTLHHGSFCLSAHLSVAGTFQATNAATACAAALVLRERGVSIPDEAIRQGLEEVRVPGRLELVEENPLVILDGAHNPAAARALAGTIRGLMDGRKLVVLFAAMADKDIQAMADELGPLANVVVITTAPGSQRAAAAETIADAFGQRAGRVLIENHAERALELAFDEAKGDAAILVSGSLYLVGFIRNMLMRARLLP